jgi:hypothetical protein
MSWPKQKTGNKNPSWKGEMVTINALHNWIRKNFGRAIKCERCGCVENKRYDWSNKDHKYSRNRKDWQMMCRGCHQKYDYKFLNRTIPYAKTNKKVLESEM